ncbi:MAG TPA: hypothetical protein ENH85_07595 [Candidatus Scalindua sp.]|nr:hypothetical protein [Candidatus Scalindua sp.]
MKTYFTTFQGVMSFVLVLFLLVSCNYNKEPIQNVTVEHSRTDSLRMFFESLDPNDQRSVFEGLPSELKCALFKNHWKNQLSMTDNQNEKEFIQGLINHLKPEYYEDIAVYYSKGDEYFEKQVEVGLTVYQNDYSKVISILMKIGGDTQAEPFIVAAALPDCSCNTAHDWCQWFTECLPSPLCIITASGCGPAGLWSCNGICQ